MTDLWQVIAELGLELHPDRIAAVAAKIESLDSADRFESVRPSFGPNVDKSMVASLSVAWQNAKGVGPREVAAALRGASAAAALGERRGSVELVWTGPSTGLVAVRHTEEVLRAVIGSSRHRLFLVSFVAYEIELIMKALHDAVGRQVHIDCLLESSKEHGGKVTVDSVGMLKEAIPSASLYVWSRDPEGGTAGRLRGAVHAKCVVADWSTAFITSANLSVAAMERNMELGVLIRGGHVPDELHRHLEALVTTKIVKRA